MSLSTTGPVRVTVPATSANLGPGFDALGLALELRDELVGELAASGLRVRVEGAGQDLPRDESHLVVRAMRAAFDVLGGQPPGLTLRCSNRIPHGRGLGSSAAAIVGGIALARALVPRGTELLDDDAGLDLAARLEGHPDNVSPALLGGLTIAWQDAAGVHAQRLQCSATVRPVALVPPHSCSTTAARGLLPAQVSHADAARNAGRAALLVAALTTSPHRLMAATEDRLHQQQRGPAMPESLALMAALRERGLPAVISGAGPTVLVLARDEDEVARTVAAAPDGWLATAPAVAGAGVTVEAGNTPGRSGVAQGEASV